MKIPKGVAVRTESGTYFINGRMKHKMPTQRVIDSWSFPRVLKCSDTDISAILSGAPLGFRDGTLVKALHDRVVYLISDRKARPVHDPDFLKWAGGKPIWISKKELELHQVGEPI